MKNIILITIDSLRADHIGSLGYAKKLTPNLDKIAENGMLFTQAFSYGSSTFFSIPPLLTSSPILLYKSNKLNSINKKKSVYSWDTGLQLYKERVTRLFEQKPTIAGVLSKYGYKTAAIHSNPYLSRYYGYGKDFSYFDDSFGEYGFTKKIMEKIKIILMSGKMDHLAKYLYFLVHRDEIPYERAEKINKKAIAWLREKKPAKFFLWIHYMDTHGPYNPPKDFRPEISISKISDLNRRILSYDFGKIRREEISQIIELYDSCIKYVDLSIKSLLNELDYMKLLENTIVIITADHGEEFNDHGDFLHSQTKLYNELLHVPLIIYGTEYTKITVDEPVSLIDIAPTIIDLLNLDKVKTFQGRSLIPVIKGEKSSGVISQCAGFNKLEGNFKLVTSYRTKKWKYILDEMMNREELYDIKADPKEKENLVTVNPIAKEIKFSILEYLSHQHKIAASDQEKEKIKRKIQKLGKIEKIK